jgi:DHA1 family tetracycline resistance protein-like MFS transporter
MPSASPRKPAVGFIFVTLVMIVLGFGIVIPVLPGLVMEFEGGDTAAGAHSFGWLVGVFALAQFVSAPVLGVLSDQFGRRKIILVALAGTAVDYVMIGLAPSIGWLYAARVIAGLTAGAMVTCNAYVADVTPPEDRAKGFGLVSAAFGLGFAIGPAIGGLLGQIDLRLPFFVAAGCVALNAIYGAFVLPESLPEANRRRFEWRRANPVGALANLRRFHGIAGLASMHFLFMAGHLMLQSTWVLYMGYRHQWTLSEVGISLMLAGIVAALVQIRLVGPILRWVGEERGLYLGLAWTVVTFSLYGVATRGWMVYAIVCFGALGGIVGPAAQSLITRRVPATEQGAVQGSLGSLASLAAIVAPPIGTWSFGAMVAPGGFHLPGVAFFEGAALCLVALFAAARTLHRPIPAPAAPENPDIAS